MVRGGLQLSFAQGLPVRVPASTLISSSAFFIVLSICHHGDPHPHIQAVPRLLQHRIPLQHHACGTWGEACQTEQSETLKQQRGLYLDWRQIITVLYGKDQFETVGFSHPGLQVTVTVAPSTAASALCPSAAARAALPPPKTMDSEPGMSNTRSVGQVTEGRVVSKRNQAVIFL